MEQNVDIWSHGLIKNNNTLFHTISLISYIYPLKHYTVTRQRLGGKYSFSLALKKVKSKTLYSKWPKLKFYLFKFLIFAPYWPIVVTMTSSPVLSVCQNRKTC